jgi:hypothetical protein
MRGRVDLELLMCVAFAALGCGRTNAVGFSGVRLPDAGTVRGGPAIGRFAAEGGLFATSAVAKYVLDGGTLELSGSEPASRRPRLTNDQIAVDATHIDAKLEGPKMKASGAVTSVLKPPQTKDDKAGTKIKCPNCGTTGDWKFWRAGDSSPAAAATQQPLRSALTTRLDG